MSPEAEALHYLGALLTGSEARDLAGRLEAGSTVTTALRVVAPSRRAIVEDALKACALGTAASAKAAGQVLRAVAGARSDLHEVHPVWTMPGHLARSAPLTTSVVDLVDRARVSVTCSTFNLQGSSGLYAALQRAAGRREVQVRLYLDAAAADGGSGPSPREVATALGSGLVFVSGVYEGRRVRNHAKFVAVDHRWLRVSSANASFSAEQTNVELGVALDDVALTEAVEVQMRDAEDFAYRCLS